MLDHSLVVVVVETIIAEKEREEGRGDEVIMKSERHQAPC